MLRVDPELSESPFDKLTVLSNVEGLTAARKIAEQLFLRRSFKTTLNVVEGSRGNPNAVS